MYEARTASVLKVRGVPPPQLSRYAPANQSKLLILVVLEADVYPSDRMLANAVGSKCSGVVPIIALQM